MRNKRRKSAEKKKFIVKICHYQKKYEINFVANIVKKVKLATLVEDDLKASFSIATTPRCRGGCYSIPWIAPLYP